MAGSPLHPRIDSVWLTDIGSFTDVKYSENWRRGSEEATWTMNPLFRDYRLHSGAVVRIFDGPTVVWYGVLAQPNNTGQFTAYGLATLGDGPLAVDSSSNPTNVPNTAVFEARARGAVPWGQAVSLNGAGFGDAEAGLTLNALLDRAADTTGTQWRVDHTGGGVESPPPTVPSWGVQVWRDLWTTTDENLVTHINVKYFSASLTSAVVAGITTADSAVAAAKWRRVEKTIDIQDQGILTSGEATAVGQGILARTGPKLQLVDPIVVQDGQLRTPGDTTAGWDGVHAGQMVRLWGCPDRSKAIPSLHTDVVVGRVERDSSTLTMTPDRAPSQTYEDIIAEMFATDDLAT